LHVKQRDAEKQRKQGWKKYSANPLKSCGAKARSELERDHPRRMLTLFNNLPDFALLFMIDVPST
jgi:hypothetical protein